MSDIAIRVENLSKQYKIGVAKYRHDTLRDQLADGLKVLFRRNGRPHPGKDTIWALKDVSFEVREGEVVGIIGRNGAGKSTLLKILSRITEPTSGYAKIHGRVGSLLEVGTGFHPELTGRENIYLNGAILGMKKAEIERKFDEIVAFAEMEKFIDTPVKRYSSGMYVRLAFAVAAHLEPEILVVDEVLAVGDAAFQKKCLGKMHNVAREGRTVLFVSHNLGAVTQLCTSALLLCQGRLVAEGPTKEIIDQYLTDLSEPKHKPGLEQAAEREGDGRLRFMAAYLQNQADEITNTPIAGQSVDIVLDFVSNEDLSHVQLMLTIYNQFGIAVTHCNIDSSGQRFHISKGEWYALCRIPKLPLPSGTYRIAVAAEDDLGPLDWVPSACVFDVETSIFFQTPYLPAIEYSTALVEHSWSLMLKGQRVE